MKLLVLKFEGGYWDGKTLRTDSPEYEEQLLAIGCYEVSHHGAVGGTFAELSPDAASFARRHGWGTGEEAAWHGDPRYLVAERRETETEVVVTFRYHPMRHV